MSGAPARAGGRGGPGGLRIAGDTTPRPQPPAEGLTGRQHFGFGRPDRSAPQTPRGSGRDVAPSPVPRPGLSCPPPPKCPPTLAPPPHVVRSRPSPGSSPPQPAPAGPPRLPPGPPGGPGRAAWGRPVRRVGRPGEARSGQLPPPHKGPGAPAAILKTFLFTRQLASPPPPPHPRTPRPAGTRRPARPGPRSTPDSGSPRWPAAPATSIQTRTQLAGPRRAPHLPPGAASTATPAVPPRRGPRAPRAPARRPRSPAPSGPRDAG